MMSVQMKISKLQTFINQNPGLADVQYAIIGGAYITPRDALVMLRRDQNVQAVITSLANIGVDPEEEDWLLTEQYYRSLLDTQARSGKKAPSIHKIRTMRKGSVTGESMTIQQAIAHIQARDLVGQSLVETYQSLRREMARRLQRTP